MTVGNDVAPRRAVDALSVPGSMIAANLVSYLLLLASARVLSRDDYGELLSLLGVLLVATVPALAMQTIAARRVAVGESSADLRSGTVAVIGVSTGALLVSAPLLSRFLHLSSIWGLLAVVATVPAVTALGTLQGVAQGERAFRRLAMLTLVTVGARSLGGLIFLLLLSSTTWCLLGVCVGVSIGAGLCWRGSTRHPRSPAHTQPADHPLRHTLVEAMHAAHGHGAFLLVTSLDVLLARHVLSEDVAGLYAAGSVITRAALWLPQSVATLAFATFTDPARHRRSYARATVLVLLIGLATAAGTAALGRFAVSVVAGAKYHALDHSAWWFAALGAALAVVQLSIIAGLALRRRGRISVVWVLAVADIVAVLSVQPDTAVELVRILTGCAVAGAVASVAFALRGRPESALLGDQLSPTAGQEAAP